LASTRELAWEKSPSIAAIGAVFSALRMLLPARMFFTATERVSKMVVGATLVNTWRGVPEIARRFTTP
jgi:hypothetical protein